MNSETEKSNSQKEQWKIYFKTALKYGAIVGLVLGCVVGAKIIGVF